MSSSNSGSANGQKHEPKPDQPSGPNQQVPPARTRQHQARNGSRDLEIKKGLAQPISKLAHGPANQKLFTAPASRDAYPERPSAELLHRREPSASQSSMTSAQEESVPPGPHQEQQYRAPYKRNAHGSDLPSSASLPAHLDHISASTSHNSLQNSSASHSRLANTLHASDADVDAAINRQQGGSHRPKSPEKKIKISAPSNGVPIGADFKRREDRRNKVKSSFWGFADRRLHGMQQSACIQNLRLTAVCRS